MILKLLAFAHARERLGFGERTVEFSSDESPRGLLARLAPQFDPSGFRVAVDCEYRDWDEPLGDAGELAIIPPVSGG